MGVATVLKLDDGDGSASELVLAVGTVVVLTDGDAELVMSIDATGLCELDGNGVMDSDGDWIKDIEGSEVTDGVPLAVGRDDTVGLVAPSEPVVGLEEISGEGEAFSASGRLKQNEVADSHVIVSPRLNIELATPLTAVIIEQV